MNADTGTRSRLSLWQASWVIAKRDFTAILFSRAFLFFLLGPLFPLLIGALAGGIGSQVRQSVERPELAVAMAAEDTAALRASYEVLVTQAQIDLPPLVAISGANRDASALLSEEGRNLGAVLGGSLAEPRLTGTPQQIERWRGRVAILIAEARRNGLAESSTYPDIALVPTASTNADVGRERILTAQGAQVLLFLLSMLLAGMVLSNLVEEKGNKIIEILAASIPMNAVFLGKLFAMLAISFVGLAVWGIVVGTGLALSGDFLAALAAPAIGWPAFCALFILYFAMNYLLLGSIFLAIGSLATTVREVQTLSMPVTMSQVLIFFFASLAMASPGTVLEWAAIAFPLSSPYALLARAATDGALWPHLLGLVWQAIFVALFIRTGADLFRRRVMKSGPAAKKASLLDRLRGKQVA